MRSPRFRFIPVFTAMFLALICLAKAQDFKKQVIYQIVTDRFFNGDTTNDNPPQSAGLFDSTQTNWFAYWGGDLAGIQQKMSYIKGMGVTAIWISPTVDNENLNLNPGNPISAPYHGYDGHDFMRVEEHFDRGDGGMRRSELLSERGIGQDLVPGGAAACATEAASGCPRAPR